MLGEPRSNPEPASEVADEIARERRFARSLFGAYSVGLGVSWLVLWVFGSYLGANAFRMLSFKSEEPPCGIAPQAALGVHTFGDFAQPRLWAEFADPWNTTLIAPCTHGSYPPVAMLLFEPFTWVPYAWGLAGYLVALLAALLAPIWWATRGLDARVRWGLTGLAILSAPVTATLDRGNVIGFLAIPLTMVALGYLQRRWRLVAAGALVAALLKIYPAFLLLLPLVQRKWRLVAATCAIGIVVTVAVWAPYTASLVDAVRSTFGNTDYDDGPYQYEHNYSSLFGVLHYLAGAAGWSGTQSFLLGHTWWPGVLYLAALSLLILLTRARSWLAVLALTLSSMQMVVPTSHRYTALFVLPVVAMVIRAHAAGEPRLGLPIGPVRDVRTGLLAACLIVSLLPMPLGTPGTSYTALQILAPLLWTLLLALELLAVAAGGRVPRDAGVAAAADTGGRAPTQPA